MTTLNAYSNKSSIYKNNPAGSGINTNSYPKPLRIRRNFLSFFDCSSKCVNVFKAVRNEKNLIKDFEWLYFNHAASLLLQRKDLTGKHLCKEYSGPQVNRLWDILSGTVSTGINYQADCLCLIDEEKKWFDISCYKFNDGAVLIFEDITEKKQVQEILSGRERYIEYIRNIACEIRNPLTSIKLAARSIKNAIMGLSAENNLQPFINTLISSTAAIENHLKASTNVHLSHSWLFVTLDISQIINQCLVKLSGYCGQPGIKINKFYSEGYFINGDPEQLSIAFIKVLAFALESCVHGDGIVSIGIFRFRGNTLVVSIKENGLVLDAGITNKSVEHSHTGTADDPGPGLVQAKQIFEEQGASMIVKNEEEKGTSFIIKFEPAAPQEDTADQQPFVSSGL